MLKPDGTFRFCADFRKVNSLTKSEIPIPCHKLKTALIMLAIQSMSERLINGVIADVPGCEAYIDDVIIYKNTWSAQIQKLFAKLGAANLTVLL